MAVILAAHPILRLGPLSATYQRSQRVIVQRMRRVQPPLGHGRIAAGEPSRLHYAAQRYALQMGKDVPPGRESWGAKGELDVDRIARVAK
jgi:hypothetical protein